MPDAATFVKATGNALTKSATNTDSVFMLINTRSGAFDTFTWTKGDPLVTATIGLSGIAGDNLVLTQITEDGTTELANGQLLLQY